jgi:3-methyl-2-oxobutanoate hydroxymethyltransferase
VAHLTIREFQRRKKAGEPIVMITAYDYPGARLVEQAGIDLILVGDSLGMVVLGYDSTVPVTLDEMIHHGKAVVRGTQRALVTVDLPFMTYQVSVEDALRNAGRLLKETGAGAVKLEGGAHVAETIRRLVQAGIPVMAHLGLTPQSVNQLGGYHVQGKTPRAEAQLLGDALAVEEAGAFALVLEAVPAPLARRVSERLRIPTIGIGAGPGCDGQVQVFHDLLGFNDDFLPHHARRYGHVAEAIRAAAHAYADDVRAGVFPTAAESFGLEPGAADGSARRVYPPRDCAPAVEMGEAPYGAFPVGAEAG